MVQLNYANMKRELDKATKRKVLNTFSYEADYKGENKRTKGSKKMSIKNK